MSREIIGVIHLPRLPTIYSNGEKGVEEIVEIAVKEARALEELGYDGVIIENYGDKPYSKRVRDPVTISVMAIIAREVVKATSLRVGINLLRNSGREAYSIAVAARAHFIRVNALSESIVSDSGLIEPEAPRLKILRTCHPGIEVYADVFVKHAVGLATSLGIIEAESILLARGTKQDYIRETIVDHIVRGGADRLIVTGLRTGEPPPIDLLKIVKKYSSKPVLVGSGVSPDNIEKILREADGVIVGSYIKRGGIAGAPLDIERARIFIEAVRRATAPSS